MNYTEVAYKDELLVDKSMRRVYNDGVEEWRHQLTDGRVEWQNNRGDSGIDELLGNGVVKRVKANGGVIYGREQGYGRTAWSDGNLTINHASLGRRTGELLTTLGLGMMIGQIVDPPPVLTAEEEEELRQKAAQQTSSDSGIRSIDGSSDYDSDQTTDEERFFGDGDFSDDSDAGGDFGDGGNFG